MKYNDFLDLMEEIAPTDNFKEIDNSGPQIYSGAEELPRYPGNRRLCPQPRFAGFAVP